MPLTRALPFLLVFSCLLAGCGAGSGSSGSTSSSASSSSSSSASSASSSSSNSSSSSSASSSSSSSSGIAGFNPCPQDGTPCKILPLGDSITDGFGTPGGYRIPLFQQALESGQNITFVGTQSNGPASVNGVSFPRSHEGHSYWRVEQLLGIVPQPALDDVPHIILLMIGTNDISAQPAAAPEQLRQLISSLTQNAPQALIVVAKIIPMDETNYAWALPALSTYNQAVEAVVLEFINAGAHVKLVDMHSTFPSSDLADGIHPNEAGYKRMAAIWYEAIGSVLPVTAE